MYDFMLRGFSSIVLGIQYLDDFNDDVFHSCSLCVSLSGYLTNKILSLLNLPSNFFITCVSFSFALYAGRFLLQLYLSNLLVNF